MTCHPLPGPGARSPFPPDQLVEPFLGAVDRDSRGAFSSCSRGTVVGRSRPARPNHPGPLTEGPTGRVPMVISPVQPLAECNISPVCRVDDPSGVPSRPPCWPPALVQWVLSGLLLPLSLSPREDGRGPGCVRGPVPPSLELALSVGRSGRWARPPPPTRHTCGGPYGFVLDRPLSSGRTCCGAFRPRRRPRARPPAPGSGVGGKVPETPRDLCALGVDEVCG